MKTTATLLTSTLGNGLLYRAVVSLPSHMTEHPLQERIVFFETPIKASPLSPGKHLEELLAKVWCTNTADWLEDGVIYNVWSVEELRRHSLNSGPANDLQLLEIGAGGDDIGVVGPDRIRYARAPDVDLFVTPRVARHLRDALDAVDLLYAMERRT